MSRSSDGSVIGRVFETTTTLYGVGQPGPMTVATRSKSCRAWDEAGNMLTSGGPVSNPVAGIASATSAAVASAPTGTAQRVTQRPRPTSQSQPRARILGAGNENANT